MRSGIIIEMDGGLFLVIETQHVKRENRRALVRTKLKNLLTGSIVEKSLRSEDSFPQAYIEDKKMQYLYKEQANYFFMDQSTYEQVAIEKEKLGAIVNFLKEGMDATVHFHKNVVVSVDLPFFIDLKVEYTEQWIKGDTAKGGTKPAKLETGATVKVPLFIITGEVIKIDTRTGEYAGRV